MKRLFSFLLIFCMMMSMCVTAGAVNEEKTEYESAQATLSALDVLRESDSNWFDANEMVTRGALSVFITRFLSLEEESETTTFESMFADVDTSYWASKSICFMAQKGILSGYGNGNFKPDDTVTYEQAVKVIVSALGFEDTAAKKGAYPWGALQVAAEKGIIGKNIPPIGKTISGAEMILLLSRAASVPAANGKSLASSLEMVYYYVSPNGDDSNPGTERKPWKTFKHAALTAKPGTTVIFEDGEYYEPAVTRFTQGGTKKAPIIYKARNKRKATLIYPESAACVVKVDIDYGQEYITVQDFNITQVQKAKEGDANTGGDSLIGCRGDHCSLIGNYLYNAYEDGIKTGGPDDLLIEGNTIVGIDHEGIDAFKVVNAKIRGNEIIDCGRVGILVKGSARNSLIYNNTVKNNKTRMMDGGIILGGISNSHDPLDVASGTGFEAYYCVAYNNVIYSAAQGLIPSGLIFLSSTNCHAYNNVIINSNTAFKFQSAPGIANGWGWDPPVTDPVVQNNIVLDCKTAYTYANPISGTLTSGHNLYYNTSKPSESDSKVANPSFVDKSSDWHLEADSPAIGEGVPMPKEIEGYQGAVFQLDLVDFDGKPRTEPWDLGIYNY